MVFNKLFLNFSVVLDSFLNTLPLHRVTLGLFLFSVKIENVALNKTTSQSGTFYEYSTADKAVDGNTNVEMEDQSCAHPGMIHFQT